MTKFDLFLVGLQPTDRNPVGKNIHWSRTVISDIFEKISGCWSRHQINPGLAIKVKLTPEISMLIVQVVNDGVTLYIVREKIIESVAIFVISPFCVDHLK
ncbi:hypothetical protein RF11_00560 [Thelohanellus kitauei]|uniref:Uncharacterized protein n=1 Tax=Thelohanellus kitauei TaxID=669202 RepID=A0A0C2N3G1_THEKT|nr:hypothetical protein RF11_00560 [Thelohanellus kitauei]